MVKQVPGTQLSHPRQADNHHARENPETAGAAADAIARKNASTAIAAGAALAAGMIAAAAIPLVRGPSEAGGGKKVRGAKRTTVVTVRGAANVRNAKVKFGSVTVSGAKPAPATVATNVRRSTDALERATKRLVTPGVVLRSKKDVPQFSAAENERGVFIRRLNGRVERGRLVDGTFRVID